MVVPNLCSSQVMFHLDPLHFVAQSSCELGHEQPWVEGRAKTCCKLWLD